MLTPDELQVRFQDWITSYEILQKMHHKTKADLDEAIAYIKKLEATLEQIDNAYRS